MTYNIYVSSIKDSSDTLFVNIFAILNNIDYLYSMRTTFIYALVDKYNEIFYIGKSDRPYERWQTHITKTIKNRYSLKYEQFKEKLPFNYIILEECDYNIWEEREIYYISIHPYILNLSTGGIFRNGMRNKITRAKTNYIKPSKKNKFIPTPKTGKYMF